MTNSPPEPPPSNSRIGLDELIAIIVAFGTIGAIFFWVLGNENRGFQLAPLSGILLDQLDEDTADDDEQEPLGLLEGQRTVIPRLEGITPPRRLPLRERFPEEPEAGTAIIDPFIFERYQSEEDEAPVARVIPPLIEPIEPEEEATVAPPVTPTEPEVESEDQQPETVEPITEAPFYEDVPEDYWAYPFIFALTDRDIYQYDAAEPLFNPDEPETRATFAAQIERAFAQEATAPLEPSDFKDIERNTQTAERIDEAVNTGFLKGYPGQVFRPDLLIPKVEVVVALATGLDLGQPSGNTDEILQTAYQDAEQIPQWARDKVAAATEAGLVANYPNINMFNPSTNATRAEVAAMIYQGLVYVNRAEPIESQYVIE